MNWKKNILITMCLFISTYANSKNLFKFVLTQFNLNHEKILFLEDRNHGILISSDCVIKKNTMGTCDAWKKLHIKNLKLSNVPKNLLRGGRSPSVVLCTEFMSGEVVIGQDDLRNEHAFCKFKDDSMVSCDSIYYFAMKNDEKRKSVPKHKKTKHKKK